MRVLLIDDNKELREFLSLTLEENDVQCVIAVDAPDVLRQLDAGRFDAAVIDSVLKTTDGIALTAQIRAHRQGRSLPILIMSAVDTSLARRMAKDAGCNEFLPKPFGAAQFIEQVKSLKR